jgi:hypothetical protein
VKLGNHFDLANDLLVELLQVFRACTETGHVGTGASQPCHHDPGHRQIDEGLTAGERALKITGEATMARDPCIGAFNDPATLPPDAVFWF